MAVGVAGPRVPLFDVRLAEAEIEAVVGALESGWLTMGPRTRAFEEAFAQYLGAAFGFAVSSGTAALHLAYLAAGVGPGDEVIVPSMSFVATAAAVCYCGAVPVFAEILGAHDFGLDPEHVASLITPKTKAVVAMHYAGYCADLLGLSELCEQRGLVLLEDAAHSPSAQPAAGAAKAGRWGLAGAFSFFSNKVLGSGEGGFICTDDEPAAELIQSRRSHGMTSGTWDRHNGHATSYDVLALGYNYRLDEPRAALLHARLGSLEDDLAARRRLVHRYRRHLAEIEGVSVPYTDQQVEHSSCYVMPVVLADPQAREPVRRAMAEEGVQTSVLYPAIHQFTAYQNPLQPPLPKTERAAQTQLTLPLYPHLSDTDQDHVIHALEHALHTERTLASEFHNSFTCRSPARPIVPSESAGSGR
jgi:dTDP-4-amino-4,6-dideoxygalactose transaminase